MPKRLPPFSDNFWIIADYFLNFLRPITARPTSPVPSSKSVAGSGTVAKILPSSLIGTVLFETKVDVVYVVESSFFGQPIIPKNTIKIHKNINNFLILSPP